jgi:hypothetical protein
MEIRYVVNRKKKLGGATNCNIVNTIDEELIENIQYNRSKAIEFHEGGKILLSLIFIHQNTYNRKEQRHKKVE